MDQESKLRKSFQNSPYHATKPLDPSKVAMHKISKKKAIIVLGMHRSGTSAMTRVLSLCGAALPKQIMPPKPDNEAGFWESVEIVAIHEEILASAGSCWDDVLEFPPSWFASNTAETFKHHLIDAVREEYSDVPLFVLKDPRICRIVPLWLSVFDDFGAEPLFVMVVRNPLEIAASLKVRNGFPQPKSMLLWLRHFLAAEKDTRGMKRAFVSYDDLLSDWRGVVQRLGAELSIRWLHRSHYVDAEIDVFVSSQLRHHAVGQDDIGERTDIVDWVKTTFDWAVRATGGQAVALEELDAVSEALRSADLAFVPIIAMSELKASKLYVDIGRLNEAISKLTGTVDNLEEQLAERDGQIASLQQEVQSQQDEIARFTSAMDKLEGQLVERDGQITALQQETQGRQDEIAWFTNAMSRLGEQVLERDSLVASLQQEVQVQQRAKETVVRDLETRLTEQDLRLRKLYASTSWRITAPLRAMKLAFKNEKFLLYGLRSLLARSFYLLRNVVISNSDKDHGVEKHVLVIDAVMLTPDQDSGSLRMWRILEILKGLGCKVTFIPSNLEIQEPYGSALQQMDIEVLCAPLIDSIDKHLAQYGQYFNVIFLSRAEVAHRFLGLVRTHIPSALLVYDTVDLHFLREERMAALNGDNFLMRAVIERKVQELDTVKKADVTLVVSPVEKAILEQYCPNARVEILSNIHDIYGSKTDYAERNGILFIGGFNHPPNSDAVLYYMSEILPLISHELDDITTYIVGSKPPPEIQVLASETVIVTGYVSDVSEYFARCRLSIAPLRYGAGVKGKINMSMAYGVPVVATPIAIEGMHLTNGQDVIVGHDAGSFAEGVIKLYSDRSLWEKLSINGFLNVEHYFSRNIATQMLKGLLNSEKVMA